MPKPTVCILGAGGDAGRLMSRCLKDGDRFDVFGWDDSSWGRKLAECDLDRDHQADLIVPVPDSLVRLWAGRPNTFLPSHDIVKLCQEKDNLAKLLGDLAPRTWWVRSTHGAGGYGAEKTMAADYLPGRNLSVELLYWHGDLKASFSKERISYSTREVEPNVAGVGQSMVSRCIIDSNAFEVARWAMARIGEEPHGIFGVDLREDEFGEPKITEINPGRWLTASYVYYSRTGYNLPRLACEIALGLEPSPLPAYPEGVGIIRALDREPWVGRLPRFDHQDIDWPGTAKGRDKKTRQEAELEKLLAQVPTG